MSLLVNSIVVWSLLVINACICREHTPLSFLGDDLHKKETLLGSNPTFTRSAPPDQVYLSISPSELTTPNGRQNIQIMWDNATMAKSSDWIGIYTPPNAADGNWLDWFYTDGTVFGEFQGLIWNMRDDYELRYFLNNGNSNYQLLGTSNVAKVNPLQPLQGHISLTKNSPYSMQIRWVSAAVKNPQVMIGLESNTYSNTFNAVNATTYDTKMMCGAGASTISAVRYRDPGMFYTVIATDLKENTKYYYKFGDSDGGWSNEYSFTTSDVVGAKSKEFTFLEYGDMGSYTNSFETAIAIEKEIAINDVQLVLHIGDISYAEGYGYIWEIWSNMVNDIASNVAYMVSIGNHEYDHTSPVNSNGNKGNDISGASGTGYHPSWGNQGDDSNGECGLPMYYRFDSDFGANANSIFWYSFDYNSVHFIQLSSEHNYSLNANGYKWLIADLKSVDRTKTPWLIVSIHRSLYESEEYAGDNEVGAHLVELLEPTLFEYSVDLVLSGHYHSYERTCSVYNYKCVGRENGGITHMTIGTGGIGLDSALYTKAEWSVFRDELNYGFGKFKVNSTHLVGQFVTNDYGVVDEVVLTMPR